MMKTYEFSTQLSKSHQLTVPVEYAKQIGDGNPVRVIVMVDEIAPTAHVHSLADLLSVEQVVALIQNTPPNLANLSGSNQELAERLANPVTNADPDFDLAQWQQEWEQIEAAMEAEEIAHEAAELRELQL